jgi:hypothetical protein
MLDFTLKKSEIYRLVFSFPLQGMYLIVRSIASLPQFFCPKLKQNQFKERRICNTSRYWIKLDVLKPGSHG